MHPCPQYRRRNHHNPRPAAAAANLTANRLVSAVEGVSDLPGRNVGTWDDPGARRGSGARVQVLLECSRTHSSNEPNTCVVIGQPGVPPAQRPGAWGASTPMCTLAAARSRVLVDVHGPCCARVMA